MADDEIIDSDNIYQNLTGDIDDVKEIDERIISFMRISHEAPEYIQDETRLFLKSVDELKQDFIANIVKCKHVEKRYEEATTNLFLCQKEYEKFQQNYLVQVGPDVSSADEEIEKRKVELQIAAECLKNAERELLFSKEKLYLVSKKAEHDFIGTLKNYSDDIWFLRYTKKAINVEKEEIYQPLHGRIESTEKQYKPYSENNYDVISRDVMTGKKPRGDDELYAEVYPLKEKSEENEDEKKLIESDSESDRKINKTVTPAADAIEPVKDEPDSIKEKQNVTRKKRDNSSSRIYREPKYEGYRTKPSSSEKKKKNKKFLNFLQKRIHGPWEGWDDGSQK